MLEEYSDYCFEIEMDMSIDISMNHILNIVKIKHLHFRVKKIGKTIYD